MKRLKLLFCVAMMLICLSPDIFGAPQQAVADSLMNLLKFQKTPEDSLKILYDVFDASEQRNKIKPGKLVLEIAKRTNNQEALIDFVPQMSVLVKHDTIYDEKLMKYAGAIQDPEHRKAVKLFIKVMRAGEEANYIPEKDLRKALLKYAGEDMTPKTDKYEDLLDLYRMVIFVGATTRGNLYLEYLSKLENEILQIPKDFGYVRNLYYTTAANCHTRNDNPEKAIEADKKLLEVIEGLESKYKKMGRKYRDYSRYYYISYRRMLSNYKALSLEEVKDYYTKCALLAEKNPELAKDFYGEQRPTIYRYMAEGNYKEAVPLLKKAIPQVRDNYTKHRLTGLIVEAADSINDQETLLSALRSYNKMLQERLKQHTAEAYSELQIRYDVEQLENDKERLKIEKRDAEMATVQKVVTVGLAALLLLVVIVMFLYKSNFSLRRLMRDLKKDNDNLHRTLEEMLDKDNEIVPGTLDVRQGHPAAKGEHHGK